MGRIPLIPALLGTVGLAASLTGAAASEPARDLPASELAQIEKALAGREYEAGPNEIGLQAPNRAHNLRTYFTGSGIRVHDRTAKGSPELLGLSLTGAGRGAALARVPAGEVHREGGRVEIRRPGLVEWFVNSQAGLEQGFTVEKPPAGAGALVIELAARRASASLAGGRILFATPTGRRLAYGSLVVRDARGEELPARFEVPAPDRVRIAVDDSGAAYPIVIDPLLSETADGQLESNQLSAHLGFSVASAGDVNGDGYADVIVGADQYDSGGNDAGAAFVFLGSASGIANGNPATAATEIYGNQLGAKLGRSVASAGDVNGDGYADVIVGAFSYDAGQTDEGAAFIFLGSASGIADGNPLTAAAQLESNQADSNFGRDVASAGDVNGDGYSDVIIAARDYDSGQGFGEGAAFIFLGSASGVASGNPATAAAQLEGNQATAQFGYSVASAGDVNGDGYSDAIVGAWAYDAPQASEGAAFVFLGSASGVASGNPATAAAQLESNQAGANLGSSVASAGDVNGDGYADVIVGAHNYDAGQGAGEGAAFVFLGSASGVASGNPATAAAQLESNQGASELGYSVASAGDVNGDGYADVIVGAPSYEDGVGEDDEGAAFVFLGGATGIANGSPSTAAFHLQANQANGELGVSVASAGDVNGDGYSDVIAGVDGYDAGTFNEGAAFVYLGGAQGIVDGDPSTAAAQLESDQANAELGWSVAAAGDVNGDGYGDVIVGAPYYDGGEADGGAAFVFHGGASGIASGNPASAATRLLSDRPGSLFGRSVASAGDVNGDGYGDVIVGAEVYNTLVLEGGAFIFLGSASGVADATPATAATRLQATQGSTRFGTSVASAGDVNGDGYGDVIVGATWYDAGQTNEGAAFVFVGSASGIPDTDASAAATRLESNQNNGELGYSVASAGDVNGDGHADVIVGAQNFDSGLGVGQGTAYVFHGSASGIANGSATTAPTKLESDQADALFGSGVASAGDVNGDGYADVIVAALSYDAGADGGAAFVFHGSATGIASGDAASADTLLESDLGSASFGSSVASAGDVNGDGYADVIVGAYLYNAGTPAEGAAFVFPGSASGIPDATAAGAAAQLEGNQNSAVLGLGVAPAGDVNGDGFADVIVGAKGYTQGQTNEGAAFVFYGNGNRTGGKVLLQQRFLFSGLPVHPWGASNDSNSFVLGMQGRHPQGRGLVKVEWEMCQVPIPFGNPACSTQVSSNWTTSLASGVSWSLLNVWPATPDTLWRWRARVLHAQPSAGAYPPKPAHGPWRRIQGQAVEADIRTSLDFDGDGNGDPIDTDDDGDGLLDVHETDTGTYVSPTNTGTDPFDSDSDDDGLLDGAEVLLGTNPNNPDHDGDGDLDGADNCPLIVNANQANGDTWSAGDACQCGDVTGDGVIAAADYQLAREHVVKGTALPAADRCDVNGDSDCDVEDLAVLERLVGLVLPPPPLVDRCDAYTTP